MDYTIAMAEQPYNMSFTAGGLLYHESLTVAALYDSLGAWDAVHARVIQDNLLKMRTHSAAQRIYREVASRLKNLTESQKALLLTGSHQEQGHMLWLAVCKRYRFIHDFATDVVREKFLRLDLALSYDDYDTFFANKAEWRPEVANVAESTRKKQRAVVFKMLREAGLLTSDHRVVPALLTRAELKAIATDDPAHLTVFPISPTELQEWLS